MVVRENSLISVTTSFPPSLPWNSAGDESLTCDLYMHLFEANLLFTSRPTLRSPTAAPPFGVASNLELWQQLGPVAAFHGRQLRSELGPIASARVHYVCVALPRVPYARPGTRVASMTTMFGHHSRGRSAFLGTSSPNGKKTDPEVGPHSTARSFGSPLFLSSYFAFILRALPLVSPNV